MSDIILYQGNNILNVQLIGLPPVIKLGDIHWDTSLPFGPGEKHIYSVPVTNLSSFRAEFHYEDYMNGRLIRSIDAALAANQTAAHWADYTFETLGTYILTIKAVYNGLLLDEVSSVVMVETRPVVFIDGQLLNGLAWWQGLPSWKGILPTNNWPANTAILTDWEVRNAGNVTATFKFMFMGKSGSIQLAPGKAGHIQFTVNTGGPGSYSYTLSLYGDSKFISSWKIDVAAY